MGDMKLEADLLGGTSPAQYAAEPIAPQYRNAERLRRRVSEMNSRDGEQRP